MAQLRRSGAKLHVTPMRRSVGPWDALDGWKLKRQLDRLGRFDVIHSHSSKAGVLARVFGARRGTTQVYSPHGFYTMTGSAPSYVGLIERVLSLASDRIVAVSQFERQHAISLGIAPARVTVIPNGLPPSTPLSRAEARARLGLDPDAFILGFVGRLEAQKDPLAAIAVMLDLRDEPVELAVIGDGGLRGEAEAAAVAAGARVRFLGALEAKPMFGAFDALLCTSRYEGMPLAFLESLNAGVPIISFPVGGTDELIDEGWTGMVVQPGVARAVQAVRNMLAYSGEERRAIAEACRAKAALHSDKTMGDATLALYTSLRA